MTNSESLPHQQQSVQDAMPPPSMPIKPNDALYSSSMRRPSFLKYQPSSLHTVMANRSSSLSVVRSAYLDAEKRRSVDLVNIDYEYGYGEDAEQAPPSKRRRFQRRDSKTPEMLMSLSASLVQLEFLDEEEKEEEERQKKSTMKESSDDDDDDTWDGGLEVVVKLVKHLQQQRRQSSTASSSEVH
jgi:hypothetical protein